MTLMTLVFTSLILICIMTGGCSQGTSLNAYEVCALTKCYKYEVPSERYAPLVIDLECNVACYNKWGGKKMIIFTVLLLVILSGCAVPEGTPNTLPRDGSNLYPGQSPFEPDWTRPQPGNDYPNLGDPYPYYIPLNGF